MEEIARGIIRWSIGFVIVSTIYLALVWWIGRKIRAAHKRKKQAAGSTATGPGANSATDASDQESTEKSEES